MNFLDDRDQDWRNPEYEELSQLLVLCAGRGKIMFLEELADSAGIKPGTFPQRTSDLLTTCRELIKVMGLQGRLRVLVIKAASEPGICAYKQKFEEMLARPEWVTPNVPTQTTTPSFFVDLSRGQRHWWPFGSFVTQDSRLYTIENKGFSIENASVLILALPYHHESYTPNEVDELEKWVKKGGGLFILGYYAADTHHFCKPSYLAKRFGFEFNNDLIMPPGQREQKDCANQASAIDDHHSIIIKPPPSSHPILRQVSAVAFLSSCSVTILPGQPAEYLLKSPKNSAIMKPEGNLVENGYMPTINWHFRKSDALPVLAARQYERGKVVVAGTWKICVLDYKDNRLLVNNILEWLSTPVTETRTRFESPIQLE